MFSSKTTRVLFKNIFPSHFATRRVLLLQSPNFTLRNFRPDLFQSLPYANSSPSHRTSPEESTSLSIPSRIIKYNIKQLPASLIANLIVTFLGLFIPIDLVYAWYRNSCNELLLNETMEKGTRPKTEVPTDEFVPRSLVVNNLKKIFTPNKHQSFYHIICGEYGTGKTTLAEIAAREAGQGVIYVNIPTDIDQGSRKKKSDVLEDFGVAFGEALNFKFEEYISFTAQFMKKMLGNNNEKSNQPKWKRAYKTFKRIGVLYKEKYGKPPVIIYDNISLLIPEYSNVLDYLQDHAKENADKRKYIAVFVSSEGSVPWRMERRSAWSRADIPVIEIGDLSKEESMEYLISIRKIKPEEAEKLYDLVGGRILNLKSVADKSLKGFSFENIKELFFGTTYDSLEKAEMNPGQENHEAAKIIIGTLLNSNNTLHVSMLRELTKVEPNNMLKYNIFAYHPRNKAVTFQSRLVECYIRENANKFIKKKRLFG
ncbi:hypothetical protein Glove_268g16 [Diversispora epigaea]|uniref:AAA+ ATPase domain-containing protein n=1 Tax=Diversispora epigaea TaxID=1348612 RepID=A0A397IA83_9GLOM|nr:hypothetical protein Glove_268g16 [Diversispora epigaea]